MYQDLRLIRLKGNLKFTLGSPNKDLGAALTVITVVG